MPPTTDKIPEKIPHDVYGTLVILTFLFTAGASLMLYDNLTKEWAYGAKQRPDRAEHITKINNDPVNHPDLIDVTKEDLEDWARAAKHLNPGEEPTFPLPESDWRWPQGFDVYKNPVKPNVNNADPTVLPEDQRSKLMLGYKSAAAAEAAPPAEAPKAPPAEAPKAPPAEAPKAPPAEAPKAPPAEAPK